MSGPVFDFESVFDENYLHFYLPRLDAVSDENTEMIWRLLGLDRGVELLDLACGYGRIANRLAARGVRVVGVDTSPLFLDRARRDAVARGVDVEYLRSDMRSLPWSEGRFDRVLSWFTSFGYFGDDDNRRVLREVQRVLRAGGQFLIELPNLAELLPRWLPVTVTERNGDFSIDQAMFDPVSGRSTTERTIVRAGRTHRFSFSVRMFLAVELRDWLLTAGFRTVEFYDRDGSPLTANGARMIAVATR